MALDHAASLEVLEALHGAGVDDRIRSAAETMYPALIDAELSVQQTTADSSCMCGWARGEAVVSERLRHA
jgi:hypothetical protein